MAKDLNYCSFIGRLGKDIEVRYMPNGNAVANFSIACNDGYKNKDTGENIDKTNWINIVIFGKLAEIAGQYLNKGSRVFLSGKQVTRSWDKDGEKKYATEVVADQMQMLDSKQGGGGSNQAQNTPTQQRPQQSQPPENDFDNEIPF